MHSTDGINWELVMVPGSPQNWWSIAFGDGRFVAVAYNGSDNNRVMYSTDGIDWTLAEVPEINSWRSVVYGDSGFVSVSNDGSTRSMKSVREPERILQLLPSTHLKILQTLG